jgi:hypothetical protein
MNNNNYIFKLNNIIHYIRWQHRHYPRPGPPSAHPALTCPTLAPIAWSSLNLLPHDRGCPSRVVVLLVWLSCSCGCPARVVVLLAWLSDAAWSSLLLHGHGLPRPHCHMVTFVALLQQVLQALRADRSCVAMRQGGGDTVCPGGVLVVGQACGGKVRYTVHVVSHGGLRGELAMGRDM